MAQVQSQNSSVEFTCRASSYNGMPTQGNVMVGNHAFEYYNEKNPQDYIQIPWDEVDYVSAEVIARRAITRFAIFTYKNGHFTFSARDNKACLRAIREHVDESRLVRSPNFMQVLVTGVRAIPHALAGLFSKRVR